MTEVRSSPSGQTVAIPAIPVTSVFGRGGAVVAVAGDYNSDQVNNSSGVAGATVSAALDALAAAIPPAAPVDSVFGRTGAVVAAAGDYNSTQVTNSSGVAGATVTAALDNLAAAIPAAGGAPANVTKAAASAGVAATFSRSDHKHDITTAAASTASIGQSNTEGVSTSLARADHTHAHSSAAPVKVTKAANSAGVATTFARSDHKHDVTTAAASSVGSANAEGSSTSLARADHNHLVTAIQTTTGPTVLSIGAIADGQVLQRSGTTIIGVAGGGGGYSTIQEEGSGLTQRATMNFIGSSVTAADDAGNSRTNITIVRTIEMHAGFPGNASSANGLMQIFGVDNNNPPGVHAQTSSGNPGINNGAIGPRQMPAATLRRARLTVAHAAVSQGTTGGAMTARFDLYTAGYSTRTLRTSLDFPITSAGVFNNLGGNNFQTTQITGLSVAITAGDLLGLQFTSRSANNNEIASIGGAWVYLEFDVA